MSLPESRVLETTTGSDTLDEIDDVLQQVWSDHADVPDSTRLNVGIAAGEIGANIVEHAAQGRAVPVRMEVVVTTNRVRVDFTDEGAPASVDLATVCLPEDMAERGRGLALARAVLETLSYRRDSANHWTLVSKPFA